MNIRKYFTSRFFIILLILLPAICTDSLLTNELSGTVHFQTIAPFFLQTENDISANKLYANATSTDNTTANDEQGGVSLSGTDDNSLYHYELICTTNTLSISENFQFNELINRIRKQGGILDFSFIFMRPEGGETPALPLQVRGTRPAQGSHRGAHFRAAHA